MFATRTEPTRPTHRCLPCLHSDDPHRRACALRHMAADRLAGAQARPPARPDATPKPRPTGPHA